MAYGIAPKSIIHLLRSAESFKHLKVNQQHLIFYHCIFRVCIRRMIGLAEDDAKAPYFRKVSQGQIIPCKLGLGIFKVGLFHLPGVSIWVLLL